MRTRRKSLLGEQEECCRSECTASKHTHEHFRFHDLLVVSFSLLNLSTRHRSLSHVSKLALELVLALIQGNGMLSWILERVL